MTTKLPPIRCSAKEIFGDDTKFCPSCGEYTPHTTVDTVDGPRLSCELCGRYTEETDEEFYARTKR